MDLFSVLAALLAPVADSGALALSTAIVGAAVAGAESCSDDGGRRTTRNQITMSPFQGGAPRSGVGDVGLAWGYAMCRGYTLRPRSAQTKGESRGNWLQHPSPRHTAGVLP